MGETIDYPDYLEHHGILGQKWGIRRYQNEDGSLTAEGRKRYTEIDKASGYYKNTIERTRQGANVGLKVGAVTAAAHLATIGMLAPAALPVAVIDAGLYAASGYAHGAVVGAIYGAAETKRGQKYIQEYDRNHRR